jgi:Putative restriction endonuclease
VAVADVDVVLVEKSPPTVRRPDLVVTTLDVLASNPKRLSAADVVPAVEIISPGSGRTDRVAKVADYADAGIPNYWIVDVDGTDPNDTDPNDADGTDADSTDRCAMLSIDVSALAGYHFQLVASVCGSIAITEPVETTIDLDALRPPS